MISGRLKLQDWTMTDDIPPLRHRQRLAEMPTTKPLRNRPLAITVVQTVARSLEFFQRLSRTSAESCAT